MILDLHKFAHEGQPAWDELDRMLLRLERDPGAKLTLEETKRLYFLYQKTSADLARVTTFAAEPEIRAHLERLVGRAYGEVNRSRAEVSTWTFWGWFGGTFPQTFRRHSRAFLFACVVMLVGAGFGAGAVLFDPAARPVIMPFEHLQVKPSERVAHEEKDTADVSSGEHASFSGELMTHNIRVSIATLVSGITWAFGTTIFVFYNGVILGGVCADYVADGQTTFLLGWLLPHGSVEIPALLISAQAGFVLGGAMIGWGGRVSMRERLRVVAPDIATLIGGVALLLVWAGIVEAFFSQYHAPVIPYGVKIAFGATQLVLVATFFVVAGRRRIAARTDLP